MSAKTKLIAGLLLILAAVLIGGRVRLEHLETERLRLETLVAEARAENERLRQGLAAAAEALAEREARRAALAAELEKQRRELEDLYNNDAPCQTWADSPLPDPVYRRLRR